jgi:hypothetical protein
MSERSALDILCSISDRFTDLCLYMTIAGEWGAVMGPGTHEECVHNQHTAIRQHLQPPRAHVLQAVKPEVCTTGMLANFNQALKAWRVVPTHVLRRLQVSSHWPAGSRYHC